MESDDELDAAKKQTQTNVASKHDKARQEQPTGEQNKSAEIVYKRTQGSSPPGNSRVVITADYSEGHLNITPELRLHLRQKIANYLSIDEESIKDFEISEGSVVITFFIEDTTESNESPVNLAHKLKMGLLDGSLVLDEANIPFDIQTDGIQISLVPNVDYEKQSGMYEPECSLDDSKQPFTHQEEMNRNPSGLFSGIEYLERLKAAVEDINIVELQDFERLHSEGRDTFPVNPMLFVAAFGSPEVVEIVCKWEGLDVDEVCVVPRTIESLLKGEIQTRVSPLFLATCLNREMTVKSIIKYSGENNISNCLQKIKISDEMEKIYMNEFAEKIQIKHAELNPVVIQGHQMEKDGTRTRVFIVYSTNVTRVEKYQIYGIGEIMIRNPYFVRKTARESTKPTREEMKEADTEKAQQAIVMHSKLLWENHSNLNIIRISPCRYRRNRQNEYQQISQLCITLYCSTKGVIPLGEPLFPTKLRLEQGHYIDVDVCEGYFQYGGYKTRPSMCRHDDLKMGCDIGKLECDNSGNIIFNDGGTLGTFVRFNGEIGFLTCAHVFHHMTTKVDYAYSGTQGKIDVVQPSTGSTESCGPPCGFVQRAIFDHSRDPSLDVAVVQISDTTRIPQKGRFANNSIPRQREAGFDELPEYNNGAIRDDLTKISGSHICVKFGSESHLTKGMLSVDGIHVRPLSVVLGLPSNGPRFQFTNQYEINGISKFGDVFRPGDSGSAVFIIDTNGSLYCIGMAIGCTKVDNGNPSAVVTPIRAILNALGPNYSLATF